MAKPYPPVTLRLVSWGGSLDLVAAAARVTVSRKDLYEALKGLDTETWIRELVVRGHGSPLEHLSYTFEATCSRVCSHQLVRHRIASYTQQSMRTTDGFLRRSVLGLCSLLDVECPAKPRNPRDYERYVEAVEKALEELRENNIDGIVAALSIGFVFNPFRPKRLLRHHAEVYLRALRDYYLLLAQGEPYEEARYILPHSVRTRIVFTMNARELLEVFIPLRTCTRAQWEIRLVAWMARTLVEKLHPELAKYMGPRCLLHENRVRRNPCTLNEIVEGACSPVAEKCPEKTPREAIRACLAASYQQYLKYVEMFPEALDINAINKQALEH